MVVKCMQRRRHRLQENRSVVSSDTQGGDSLGSASAQLEDAPLESLDIYISGHCFICQYSYEVAALIRHDYPHVRVRMIDMENLKNEVPEAVFATPTYLLNGSVWSLGNPSQQKIVETFATA